MKISVLGSCSKGNSTYIDTGDAKILIDVGFSRKKVNEKLNEIGESLENIDAIFITHEHSDHVQGLPVIMKNYDVDVFMHKHTYKALKSKLNDFSKRIKIIENGMFKYKNNRIEAILLSHDANACLGYTITNNIAKFGYITDTGRVDNIIRLAYKDCNILAIESNYDRELLAISSYPQSIKDRIKSNYGHLSNEDAIKFIQHVYNQYLDKIYLMHISKENNSIEKIKLQLQKLTHIHSDIELTGEHTTKIYRIKNVR